MPTTQVSTQERGFGRKGSDPSSLADGDQPLEAWELEFIVALAQADAARDYVAVAQTLKG